MTMLLTWRDIVERLQSADAAPWSSVEGGPDEVRVFVPAEAEEAAQRALVDTLGTALGADERKVRLESLPDRPRLLSIVISTEPSSAPAPVVRPLWRSSGTPAPDAFPAGCRVLSFHSYKGGVGRSTAVIATLGALLRRRGSPRVLVVDADIEAPGLTWTCGGVDEGSLSLVDLLCLLQDSDDWRAEVIPLASAWVRASPRTVEIPEVGTREFYFLPSMRKAHHIFAAPVLPEQAVRRHGRTWIVGDALQALGAALGASVVLVDARAGLTELAAPLFLDPRITSVLVTTCDPQAEQGTRLALSGAKARNVSRHQLLVSMVPPPPIGDELFQRISSDLIFEMVGGESTDEVVPLEDANVSVLRSDFAQELLSGGSLSDLLVNRIPGTSLGKAVGPQLAELALPVPKVPPAVVPPAFDLQRFAEIAARHEFAEKNAQPGLLPIPALKALVELPPGQLPNRVVLGAKGSGKTFAWAQMVLAGDWSAFARQVGAGVAPSSGTPIIAVSQSDDLGDELLAASRKVERALGLTGVSPLDVAQIVETASPEDPFSFWLQICHSRLGLAGDPPGTIRELLEGVRQRLGSVVLVLDGLERFFQVAPGVPLPEPRRRLLRALLQDIPNRLREEPNSPLGIVTFIRRDLAAAVITQNFGQFESRYADTTLRWGASDALRLVGWLLQAAGWPSLQGRDLSHASTEELVTTLEGFWGEKLGGDKEAYSYRWVLAALSDFNVVLQARDLVRFLRFAAESQRNRPLPLQPSVLRNALPGVSSLKVSELEAEIPGVKPIFTKMRSASDDVRVVPLSVSDVRLEEAEVLFLEQVGLLVRPGKDPDVGYLPEVVRHGLGFRLGRRGRARIVTLYTQALRRVT